MTMGSRVRREKNETIKLAEIACLLSFNVPPWVGGNRKNLLHYKTVLSQKQGELFIIRHWRKRSHEKKNHELAISVKRNNTCHVSKQDENQLYFFPKTNGLYIQRSQEEVCLTVIISVNQLPLHNNRLKNVEGLILKKSNVVGTFQS